MIKMIKIIKTMVKSEKEIIKNGNFGLYLMTLNLFLGGITLFIGHRVCFMFFTVSILCGCRMMYWDMALRLKRELKRGRK